MIESCVFKKAACSRHVRACKRCSRASHAAHVLRNPHVRKMRACFSVFCSQQGRYRWWVRGTHVPCAASAWVANSIGAIAVAVNVLCRGASSIEAVVSLTIYVRLCHVKALPGALLPDELLDHHLLRLQLSFHAGDDGSLAVNIRAQQLHLRLHFFLLLGHLCHLLVAHRELRLELARRAGDVGALLRDLHLQVGELLEHALRA
eukprot:2390060-Pleurochrysis_carterae.AAC.4